MARKRRVLVVEDHDSVREWVALALARSGYETVEAADGETGLREAREPRVDLVLLDLLLPRMDGFSVLTELRKSRPSLPVIIFSGQNSEEQRVQGLQLGADDYLGKPFSERELLARVEAVLRRIDRTLARTRISFGDTVVDCLRREVRRGDQRMPLSQTEVEILEQLAATPDQPVAREALQREVLGIEGQEHGTRAVDMHIARLRHKLSAMTPNPDVDWIITVRGAGYMLGRVRVTRQ